MDMYVPRSVTESPAPVSPPRSRSGLRIVVVVLTIAALVLVGVGVYGFSRVRALTASVADLRGELGAAEQRASDAGDDAQRAESKLGAVTKTASRCQAAAKVSRKAHSNWIMLRRAVDTGNGVLGPRALGVLYRIQGQWGKRLTACLEGPISTL